MSTPAIIMIVLMSLLTGMALVMHGKPKGNWNFWGTLFGMAIEIWILYAGGFFN